MTATGVCPSCEGSDTTEPFSMDGFVDGEYREQADWISCRECGKTSFVTSSGNVNESEAV